MKVALVITTYNWKEALAAVLDSVLRQSTLPDEVIIADDGSKEDTAQLIQTYQDTFPCPLIHSWQEDDGFRLSASRNKAISKVNSEYIILIDGDIVLHKDFIKTHKLSAQNGYFVQGGRVIMSDNMSQMVMKEAAVPNLFSKGIRNRHNTISNNILTKIFSKVKNNIHSTRGCNIAFWKKDLIEVNGFNEDFIGWGREDAEFTLRMLNSNLNRLYLKFSGIGYHLYHKENSRETLAINDDILDATEKNKLQRCENGIDKYL